MTADLPPRVLFAIGGLEAGGSETQLTEMLVRLHPELVDAHLVLTRPPDGGPRLQRLLAAGIEPTHVGPLRGELVRDAARISLGYERAIRRVRPAVVYPWLEESSLFMVPIATAHRVPAVVARRNISGARSERRQLARFAIRRAERLARLVTVNSQAAANAAVRRGVRPDRVRLVPNGHPPLAALPLPDADEVVLGYLARFRPEKGHHRLLSVLAALPAGLRWRVHLGGDGELEQAIEAEATRVGLRSRLRFLGAVSNPRAFWAECDIALLFSDHEGSPNALIEAAIAGRPLVATAVGGSVELVRPGMGVTVPPDDPKAIAVALRGLIADSGQRRAMGAEAHRRATTMFDIRASVNGHLDAIHCALADRH
jgi:glycosyltransferase involved in cell wall biosynthesis